MIGEQVSAKVIQFPNKGKRSLSKEERIAKRTRLQELGKLHLIDQVSPIAKLSLSKMDKINSVFASFDEFELLVGNPGEAVLFREAAKKIQDNETSVYSLYLPFEITQFASNSDFTFFMKDVKCLFNPSLLVLASAPYKSAEDIVENAKRVADSVPEGLQVVTEISPKNDIIEESILLRRFLFLLKNEPSLSVCLNTSHLPSERRTSQIMQFISITGKRLRHLRITDGDLPLEDSTTDWAKIKSSLINHDYKGRVVLDYGEQHGSYAKNDAIHWNYLLTD